MGFRDILVHLRGTPNDCDRLRVAAELARHSEAHITALFVEDRTPLNWTEAVPATYLAGEGFVLLQDSVKARLTAACENSRENFHRVLNEEPFAGSWTHATGPSASTIALHARHADVTLLGTEDPTLPGYARSVDAVEYALFTSGRPLLVLPDGAGAHLTGGRAMVCWDAGTAAARAVNDAIPLLQRCSHTTIVTVRSERVGTGIMNADDLDIALHLARHGVKAELEVIDAEGGDVTDLLLSRAIRLEATLLVAGGYGHSRFREVILGGVTKRLLQATPMPMLLSH